jgi:hypothetical protein
MAIDNWPDKACDCANWKAGTDQLYAVAKEAYLHGVHYLGPVMVYCPWCGKELK